MPANKAVSLGPFQGSDGFEGFDRDHRHRNPRGDTSVPSPEGERWPPPRPISGTLAEVPALNPDLLPLGIREWVLDLAERFQVPPDYPAAAVITMLAGALGRRALISPKRHDDWVVYSNLWGAIVGRSGVMKSPIIHAALGPLRRRQALALTIYESELDEYRREFRECRRRKTLRRYAPVPADAVDVPLRLDGDTRQEPRCARYLTNEISIEKLHLVLKENPAGVLLFRDELSGWIAQLAKPGRERERSFYLETWAGNGDFIFDRIARGTVHADRLCLSVFGGIQPSPLQAFRRGCAARSGG